jgi:Fe-S-cluster containining protein
MSGENAVEEYFQLRKLIDGQIRRIRELYEKDIVCQAGCSSCCTNFTVFPVEFYAILQDLRTHGLTSENIRFNISAECGFLNEERLCRIYASRPIICRTHGLPILFLNDSPDNPEWEVSYCERNFGNSSELEFNEECLINVEEINLELDRINKAYVQSEPGDIVKTRIPLRKLVDQT